MKKIFIVILHFGEFGVTRRCVESLFLKDPNFDQIIIVNNTDRSIAVKDFGIKTKKLICIQNPRNLGFAGGVNVGIRYGLAHGASHILLLNNDTVIEKPILLSLVHVFTEYSDCGIAAPAIGYNRGGNMVYDIGGDVNLRFGRTQHMEVDFVGMSVMKATYVSGCCMLVSADVFRHTGFFDEQFFLYYEDVDFCLRAAKDGFATYVLPQVSLYHELSSSVGKVSKLAVYHQTRSALLFGKKYVHPRVMNICFVMAQSILFVLKKPGLFRSVFKGVMDGI